MISEALLYVVPKDLFVLCLDFGGFVTNHFGRFVLFQDFGGFVNYRLHRISKSLLAGIDLYFARFSKALLAICIIRISYWYDRQVFRSCVVCFDFSRK
jgi:hypothetical protein